MQLRKIIIPTVLLLIIAGLSTTLASRIVDTSKKVNLGIANFAISHGHCNLIFSAQYDQCEMGYANDDLSTLKLEFSINTTTLEAKDNGGELTAGLQSTEQFNGDGKHYIKFNTEDVFILGSNWYQLRGTMSLNGFDKTLRLRATPIYQDGVIQQFVVDGSVNLSDFGLISPSNEVGQIMFMNLVIPYNLPNNKGC